MTEQSAAPPPPGPTPARRTRWWIVALAVLLVAAVVGVVVGAISSPDEPAAGDSAAGDSAAGDSTAEEPVATRLDDGISFGASGPLVEVYLDIFCASCGELETRVGAEMADLVRAGELTLVLRPVNFVSPFSDRAAAALSCTVGSGHTLAYQEAMFAAADGLLAKEVLVELATDVGIDDSDFEECIDARETKSFVRAISREARQRGVEGVPALFIAGNQVDLDVTATPADFRAALDELAG